MVKMVVHKVAMVEVLDMVDKVEVLDMVDNWTK